KDGTPGVDSLLVRAFAPYLVRVIFFQAEDGIRDATVTGVQTCALPISALSSTTRENSVLCNPCTTSRPRPGPRPSHRLAAVIPRSEERRVGKECRWRTTAEA